MKNQMLILTLLMSAALALAFPVPDEEVALGSAATSHVGEIKTTDVGVDVPALKTVLPIEEAKTPAEALPVAETKAEKPAEAKKIEKEVKLEEKHPAIPALRAPDSELASSLPEQLKPEKEKNVRAENVAAEGLKSLPSGLFETPVVAPSAVETQQPQIVEEIKPVLQVIEPQGKSAAAAAVAAEEPALKPIALEEKPAMTADAVVDAAATQTDAIAAPEAAAEKATDLTGRQERGGNEAKKESDAIIAAVPASAPAETLKEELIPLTTADMEKPLETADLKLSAIESKAEAAVGDIEKPAQLLEDKEPKIQELTEKKEIMPEGKKIETDVAKESAIVQQPEAITNETAQPQIIAESKDSSEEKQDSVESKESAESDERKAKSEENMSN